MNVIIVLHICTTYPDSLLQYFCMQGAVLHKEELAVKVFSFHGEAYTNQLQTSELTKELQVITLM